MMVTSLEISDVKVVRPIIHIDSRGFFSEVHNSSNLREKGISSTFVQDNHSLSKAIGVLRGLHYQVPPFGQDKLVRVVSGKIWDVAVDIRPNSPSYKKWVAQEISRENWLQIFVPQGFAHGFVTLEEKTEVIYKTSNFYSPEHQRSISWNDVSLNIDWPFEKNLLQMSENDSNAPCIKDLEEELLILEKHWL